MCSAARSSTESTEHTKLHTHLRSSSFHFPDTTALLQFRRLLNAISTFPLLHRHRQRSSSSNSRNCVSKRSSLSKERACTYYTPPRKALTVQHRGYERVASIFSVARRRRKRPPSSNVHNCVRLRSALSKERARTHYTPPR